VTDETEAQAKLAQATFDKIAPILFGMGSAMQGNIIAMLLGMWLSGHHVVPTKSQNKKEAIKAERDLRSRLMMVTTRAAFAYAADQDQTRDGKQEPQ
jgi:hypothetical protein